MSFLSFFFLPLFFVSKHLPLLRKNYIKKAENSQAIVANKQLIIFFKIILKLKFGIINLDFLEFVFEIFYIFMLRWLIFLLMSLLTLFTGGVVTWEFNSEPETVDEKKMVEIVKKEMEKSPMKYVVIKYGIEWKNDDMAIVSGKTIFNMPVVTAQIDKKSVKSSK